MFKTIVRKEILTYILDGAFLFFSIFCIVLTMVTVVYLVPEHREALEAYSARVNGWEDEVKGEIETFENYGLRFRELKVYKRPAELWIFASGAQGILDGIFRVTGTGQILGRRDRKADQLAFESGAVVPDFAYVVSMLLSLIAILYASTSIARERREGTLQLLLSNPVSRATLILGKYLGEMVILSVLVLIIFLLYTGAVAGSMLVELRGDMLLRLISMLGVAFVYLSIFVLSGILVSCLTRNYTVSTTSALLVWIVLVVLYPNSGYLLGIGRVEVPRLYELAAEYQVIDDQIDRMCQEQLRPYQELVTQRMQEARHAKGHDGIPPDLQEKMNETVRRIEHWRAQRKTQLEEMIGQKQAQQVQAGMNWARLSPTASYVFLTSALSSTGFYRQQDLLGQVKRYVEQLSDYFGHLGYDVVNGEIKYRPVNLQQLPRFRERTAKWSEIWSDAGLDLIVLLLFNGAILVLCYMIFLRMEVVEIP